MAADCRMVQRRHPTVQARLGRGRAGREGNPTSVPVAAPTETPNGMERVCDGCGNALALDVDVLLALMQPFLHATRIRRGLDSVRHVRTKPTHLVARLAWPLAARCGCCSAAAVYGVAGATSREGMAAATVRHRRATSMPDAAWHAAATMHPAPPFSPFPRHAGSEAPRSATPRMWGPACAFPGSDEGGSCMARATDALCGAQHTMRRSSPASSCAAQHAAYSGRQATQCTVQLTR
jgi:hypothetical protein